MSISHFYQYLNDKNNNTSRKLSYTAIIIGFVGIGLTLVLAYHNTELATTSIELAINNTELINSINEEEKIYKNQIIMEKKIKSLIILSGLIIILSNLFDSVVALEEHSDDNFIESKINILTIYYDSYSNMLLQYDYDSTSLWNVMNHVDIAGIHTFYKIFINNPNLITGKTLKNIISCFQSNLVTERQQIISTFDIEDETKLLHQLSNMTTNNIQHLVCR